MKNTLAENMLRFGTKNLTTAVKQRLMEVNDPLLIKMMPDIKAAENYFLPLWNQDNPGTRLAYTGTNFIYKVAASLTPEQIVNSESYKIRAYGLVQGTIDSNAVGDPTVSTMPVLVGADAQNYLSVMCDGRGMANFQDGSSPASKVAAGDVAGNIAVYMTSTPVAMAFVNRSFNIFSAEMLTSMAKSTLYAAVAKKIKSNPLYSKFSTQLTGNAKTFYDLLPGQAVPSPQKVVPAPVVPVKKP